MTAKTDSIVTALGSAGRRLTAPRRAVAAAIAAHEGYFTAEEVLDASQTRERAVGRATVFRSLELLTALGLVERVDLPSGEHAYVACEPAGHHHHLVCSTCGRSTEVAELGLDRTLDRIESSTGFQIESHRLELFGQCADCRRTHGATESSGDM